MYNEPLAQQILEILDKAFPEKRGLPDLKQASQEFSQLPNEDWLLAVDALNKEGLVDGTFYRPGAKQVLSAAAYLEITAAGRRQVRDLHVQVEDSLHDQSADLDSLLQIYNRGRFDADMKQLVDSANSEQPLSLVMIDLDHFKTVNDTYGHPVGDGVLKKGASLVQSVCRQKGLCYRYGGEELAVLLPNYSLDEAVALAERVRLAISQADFTPLPDGMTASFGVATCSETARDPKELVDHADRALYDAKEGGRNCVCKAGGTESNADRNPSLLPLGAARGDLSRRVDAVELRLAITQGNAQYFIMEVKNDSHEEVCVLKICLEKNGILLTEPARPNENDDWKVPPKSSRPIGWHASPNPASALSRMNPNEGVHFTTDIEVILSCAIIGRPREFRQKLLVKVILKSAELRQLAG